MTKIRSTLLLPLFALAGLSAAVAVEPPRTLLLSGPSLVAARAGFEQGDRELQPARNALLAEADQALKMTPPSVMDKPLTAASGDKHDYYSFGPYWWPDPTKPDGLPYIRRDGEVNPTTRHNSDDGAFSQLSKAIETLGLAYWFTQDERYAQKAAVLLRVWFLDPATRMNPNLQHAQAIPGITEGRGIGLIESRRFIEMNDAIALLADSSAWTAAEQAAYRAWLADFYTWLTTSANGRDELNEKNNHGTWCDAQTAALALVLDRPTDAKKILTAGLDRRLAQQIEPDGSQPLELARTNSLGYSCFNLEALFTCARLAEHVGIDWWNYTTADGRSLHAALAYLGPYVDPAKVWPKTDLHPAERNRLVPLLAEFLRHRHDAALLSLWEKFSGTVAGTDRGHLLNASPPPGASRLPQPLSHP